MDFQGVSIARKLCTESNGSKFYSELQRRSFRKYETGSNGSLILNPDFSSQIDEWTGIQGFLTSKFNF